MEKGNGAGTATQVQQATNGGAAGGAAPGGAAPGGEPAPGTGTGTAPTGNPPPVASGGGGSQADQSGPDDRPWEVLESRIQNPDGTWTRVETDGNAALRHTTYDSQGNVVSQEIFENENTGGWQPPAEEPDTRTYQTDGGLPPPPGGPEPFSDVPPDPSMPERTSWRDMPAQEREIPGGARLSLDGQGGLEFSDGERTFRREGGKWVDTQTGERAPSDTAKRATGATNDLELGLPPQNRRI